MAQRQRISRKLAVRPPPAGDADLEVGGPIPERHRGWGAIRSGSDTRLRPPPAGEARSGY